MLKLNLKKYFWIIFFFVKVYGAFNSRRQMFHYQITIRKINIKKCLKIIPAQSCAIQFFVPRKLK